MSDDAIASSSSGSSRRSFGKGDTKRAAKRRHMTLDDDISVASSSPEDRSSEVHTKRKARSTLSKSRINSKGSKEDEGICCALPPRASDSDASAGLSNIMLTVPSTAAVAGANQQSQASRKRRCRREQVRTHTVQTYGDSNHVFLFQEDKTGRRQIHPSALRFALKLAEEEARETRDVVSQSLAENGELDESRRVQLHSSHHVTHILSKLRAQLAQVTVRTGTTNFD